MGCANSVLANKNNTEENVALATILTNDTDHCNHNHHVELSLDTRDSLDDFDPIPIHSCRASKHLRSRDDCVPEEWEDFPEYQQHGRTLLQSPFLRKRPSFMHCESPSKLQRSSKNSNARSFYNGLENIVMN